MGPNAPGGEYLRYLHPVHFAAVLVLLACALHIPAEGVSGEPSERARSTRAGSTYHADSVFDDSKPILGGIQVADADGDGREEILTVGVSARLNAIWWDESGEEWQSEMLFRDSEQMMDVEVADVNLSSPGKEIFTGGYSRNLTQVVLKSDIAGGGETEVRASTVWTCPYHIYGVDSGDIDTTEDGPEIAVVDRLSQDLYIITWDPVTGSYDGQVINLTRDTGRDERLTQLAVGEFYSGNAGEEIVVMDFDGGVHMVYHDPAAGWRHEVIWVEPGAGIRTLLSAAIGEFDDGNDGAELVVVGWTGNVTEIYRDGSGWANRTLWVAEGSLEGLAIGDFDPLLEGNEILIGGYTNTGAVVHGSGGNWAGFSIYKDPEAVDIGVTRELSGAAVGDVYPGHDGIEAFLASSSGKVFMLYDEKPGFTLLTPKPRKTASPGETATFPIRLETMGGFKGGVTLEFTYDGLDFGHTFQTTTVTEEQDTAVSITVGPGVTEGPYAFTVLGTADSGELTAVLEFHIDVEAGADAGEAFLNAVTVSEPAASNWRPEPGELIEIEVTLENAGTETFPGVAVNISTFGHVIHTEVVTILPNSTLTVNTTWEVPEGEYQLQVKAHPAGDEVHAVGATSAVSVKTEDDDGDDTHDEGGLLSNPLLVAVVIVLLLVLVVMFARWFSFSGGGGGGVKPPEGPEGESGMGKQRKR